ncbi:MAG: hypothetical protein MUE46_06795 [Xanthomonadales bacterium]|nr:hypothetical protein [Xanthomonadales bacterium]
MSYQYDRVGNRTRTTSANQVLSYQFDANRLTAVRSGTPSHPPTDTTPAHRYEYAPLPSVASLRSGLRTAEVRPNATRTEYAYHVRNHVTTARSARRAALADKAAAGALLLGLSYGVDALVSLASLHSGLRNSIAQTVDGGAPNRVTAYQCGANKRLIREEITRADTSGSQVTSWVYDGLPAVASRPAVGSLCPALQHAKGFHAAAAGSNDVGVAVANVITKRRFDAVSGLP